VLLGTMPSPAVDAEVAASIHRCLSPDAAERPTAAELRAALSGRGAKREDVPSATSAARTSARAPTVGSSASGARVPVTTDRVQLVGDGGRALAIGIRTIVGKHLVRQFGADAEFWDAEQCILDRLPDRRWQLTPGAATANETLLNGEVLTAPQPLRDGDVIAVGRKAKGIIKLPLTVRAA